MSVQRNLAVGILGMCLLAVVVGVFNAFSLPTQEVATSSDRGKSSMASLLVKSNRLLLIELTGPIYMDSPQDQGILFSSDTNAMAAKKALDQALEDKSVKGVLLRIDSPGGTVAMSQELNAAVRRVSQKKPVVASLGDMAASGGYYTACAADKIVVNPGTLTASIGVIISTLNMKNLFEDKLGVKAVTVKSGKFKDILSPYKEPSSDDLALMQHLIDDSYQDFLGAVIEGRTRYFSAKETEAKQARIASIKAVADGRVVHGKEAVKVGLADELGDLHEAYQLLDKMAKERFGLKDKGKLPLENANQAPSLLDLIGLGGRDATEARLSWLSLSKPDFKDFMPLSMRYPHQPLWVLE